MASITFYVPGTDAPVRTTETARLRRIQARAKASAAVVELLASLAFGPDHESGWPPALCVSAAVEVHAHA